MYFEFAKRRNANHKSHIVDNSSFSSKNSSILKPIVKKICEFEKISLKKADREDSISDQSSIPTSSAVQATNIQNDYSIISNNIILNSNTDVRYII